LGEDTRADRVPATFGDQLDSRAHEALADLTATFCGRPWRLTHWSNALIVCIGHSSNNDTLAVGRPSTSATGQFVGQRRAQNVRWRVAPAITPEREHGITTPAAARRVRRIAA
jgi:hypothetical protein